MMASIMEFFGILAMGYLGLAHLHPNAQNNPLVQHPERMIGIAVAFGLLFFGYQYYGYAEEQWEFTKNQAAEFKEKGLDDNQIYCVYAEKHAYSLHHDEAELACNPPVQMAVVPPAEPAAPAADAAEPAPAADAVAPEPAADAAAPAPAADAAPAPAEEWQTLDRYQVKDGLVKDTQNNLMWMRCSLGQAWDGSTCTGEAVNYTWADAMKQESTSHEGYSDWRVPTIQELKSLVYCSSGQPKTWFSDVDPKDDGCKGDYVKPTIKTDAFPNTSKDGFWSSSPSADVSNYAWIVVFGNGYDYSDYRDDSYAVRLVRAGQ
jgi:hypothetical protein